MGQISHPTLGSPHALVTSQGELLIAGSVALNSLNVLGNVQILDGEIGPVSIDKSTNNIGVITNEHHEIHEGKMFHLFMSGAGGAGYQISVGLMTSNDSTWSHIIHTTRSNVEAHSELWEGATLSGGIVFTPFNRNRNSVNMTADTNIILNPIISGGIPTSGLEINRQNFGANKTASEIRGRSEWVLKSGTSYLFVLQSEAASADLNLELDWYEHTDKTQQF